MTSIAAPTSTTERSRLNRALVLSATVVAGAICAAWTVWFVTRSSTLFRPTASGILQGSFVAAYIGAGVYTWWRRPESRLGPLVASIGFATSLSVLNSSSDERVYTLGMTAWALTSLLLVYMALCFPASRPNTQLELRFARVLWLTTGALWALILLLAENLPKGGEFSDCGAACPQNAFQLVDTPIGNALDALYSLTISLMFLGVAALLVRKARSPLRMRRRAIEPLCYVMCATIVVFVLNLAVARVFPSTKTAFFATLGVLFLATPTSIVVGQVRGRMFAAASAGRVVGALSGREVTPDTVEAFIRETLGDPTLALVRAVPETGGYVDSRGGNLELPVADEERAVTPIVRDGRTVAALVHDPALDVDAAVLEGLVASSLMLLENARLVEELRASRGRIVTAAEHQRLKLERDLHDGAQQRLMAIQIKLALLQEQIGEPQIAEQLDEIAGDAASAVEELRSLAHGIYPTVLRERGLPDALRSHARGVALPVEINDEGIGRCEPAVEAAVYFCVAEAIQNATKHAGPGTRVVVTLGRHGDEATFDVVDDGAGFDLSAGTDGIGLVSMRDRIGAVGGELEVVSSPGRGMAVRGRVPAVGPVATDG